MFKKNIKKILKFIYFKTTKKYWFKGAGVVPYSVVDPCLNNMNQ